MPGVADGGALSDLLRAQAVCPVRAVQGRAVCRNAVAFGALVSAGCGCGCWSGLRRDFRTYILFDAFNSITSHEGVTVESGQESRWSQGRSHGGVTQESRWSHEGVTVESRCPSEERQEACGSVDGVTMAIRSWKKRSAIVR